jgi:hypothetical protein
MGLTTLWNFTSTRRMQLLWNSCLLGNQSQKIIAVRRIVCVSISARWHPMRTSVSQHRVDGKRKAFIREQTQFGANKHGPCQREKTQLTIAANDKSGTESSVIELLLNKWPKDKQWAAKLAGGWCWGKGPPGTPEQISISASLFNAGIHFKNHIQTG